jgi:hypothetical protein
LLVMSSPRPLVDNASDPNEAYELCLLAREQVRGKLAPIVKELKKSLPTDMDKRYAQAIVANWRGDVALATTQRDVAVSLGITEFETLCLMDATIQPGLDQMDGGVPLCKVLMGNPKAPKNSAEYRGRPDIISKLTGIDQKLLVDDNGASRRWATPALNELRKANNRAYKADMYTLMSVAMEPLDESNPHSIILNAFRDIRPW